MKASGLQATWLIVSWMRADVHKMGNDRWTHPPLINICNWIMRLNSAHTPSESSVLEEIEPHAFIRATYLRHRMKSASGNGLMGFKGRFSAAAMEFQNTICHLGQRRLCINGSAFLSAPASRRRNMEKSRACHRFSPRHLRFNCGDMNAIFVSAALKLNGQTAAIGE